VQIAVWIISQSKAVCKMAVDVGLKVKTRNDSSNVGFDLAELFKKSLDSTFSLSSVQLLLIDKGLHGIRPLLEVRGLWCGDLLSNASVVVGGISPSLYSVLDEPTPLSDPGFDI
jgi:hypothetical protein